MALPPDKKSIAVTVSKETYEKIKKLAQKDKRSMSFVVNEFIEDALKKK